MTYMDTIALFLAHPAIVGIAWSTHFWTVPYWVLHDNYHARSAA